MGPRKIKVVDVEEPSREYIVSVLENEPPQETTQVEELPTVSTSEPAPVKKPKAIRAPREKKTIDTSLLDVGVNMSDEPKEEPKEDPKEEPKEENQNIKTIKLVECPKCNKKLTSRTLKYSHEAVCPANENREKAPVVKKTVKREEDIQPVEPPPPPQLTAHEKRINTIREKQNKFKNLALMAF